MQLCIRQLETIDQPTRQALATFCGHMLASSQVERARPPPDAKKAAKGKDKDNADEDDVDIASAPPASSDSPMFIMTAPAMFGVLSTAFNRPSTSRKTRIGIFDFYIALLTSLGPSFVENNYSMIVRHLMENIVSYPYPRNLSSRHDSLLVRHGISVVLRDLLGLRMLSEQGQIGAIRELANSYLKKWPALMPGEKEPSKEVLVVALREVSGLVAQMGNAPPPVQASLPKRLF